MVKPDSTTAPSVADLHRYLQTSAGRWLTTTPHMAVSFNALARLVHHLLTEHTTAVRAQVARLAREHAEIAEQAWNVSSTVARLTLEGARLRGERDAAIRESQVREQDIIALTVERDQALARVAELEDHLSPHGEPSPQTGNKSVREIAP